MISKVRNFLLNKITSWCKRTGRYRVIYDRDGVSPYLERYYIFLQNRGRFPFNAVIHKILRSDLDDLHDHPWAYATLILKGGYHETTPSGTFWRRPGWFTFRKAKSLHRLEINPNVECWTLFFMGPRKREWGFLKDGEWIQWEEYLEQRQAQ